MLKLNFAHEHCSEIDDFTWQLPPHDAIAPEQMLALGRKLFEHPEVASIEFDRDCDVIRLELVPGRFEPTVALTIDNAGELEFFVTGQRYEPVDGPAPFMASMRYLNPIYYHADCEARTSLYEFMSKRVIAVGLYNGLVPHVDLNGSLLGRATREVTNPGNSGAYLEVRGMGFNPNRDDNSAATYQVVRAANVQGLVGDTTTIGWMQDHDIEWLNTAFLDLRAQIVIAPYGETVQVMVPQDISTTIEGVQVTSATIMTKVNGYRLVGYVI